MSTPTLPAFRARLPGLFLVLLGGCVLAPAGTRDERDRLTEAGRAFERRELPELSPAADWKELLHRALLANGEIEAAWQEWRGSLARVDGASSWPDTNLSLDAEYLLSPGGMKAWDRTTLRIGFDPMQNLSLPSKVRKQGEVALSAARAAGERFAAKKFEVQRRVLEAWLDWALTAERLRLQVEIVSLLELRANCCAVQVPRPQRELLQAQLDVALAEDEKRSLEAEARQRLAVLNGLLAREHDAPLTAPEVLPSARELAADDERLIALFAEASPELRALAHEVQGRRDALELARLRFLPDVSPFFGITGSIESFVGASISLPTQIPALRAALEEARADLARGEAVARQARSDRGSEFVAALIALRNAERTARLLSETALPAAERMAASSAVAYTAGAAMVDDWIDSARAVLDVRVLLARARVEREKQLAGLEALAGVDFETLASEVEEGS